MFCKHIVGDVKSNGTKILNREYRRRAGIPFPKRMNLPKARYETGNVGNHSIDANAFIAETALLLNVMIQCPAQILPVQIVYRFIFQYPLFFRDIVVTNFACVLNMPVKIRRWSAMYPWVLKREEACFLSFPTNKYRSLYDTLRS